MHTLKSVTLLSLSLFLISCGDPRGDAPRELRVYAAASLIEAMTEIGELFSNSGNVAVSFNFASSGALARQILAAPRADIYLSANQKWMDEVENAGLLANESRITLLSNQLVVIQNLQGEYAWDSSAQFFSQPFRYLSLGDPQSVPAGQYAKQWLEQLSFGNGQNGWSTVESRISPTTDVRAALFQVRSHRDVVGIVYRTDMKAYPDAVKELYVVPMNQGPDISYPAAVLKASSDPHTAQTFLAFLQEPEARKVFENLGFVVRSAQN